MGASGGASTFSSFEQQGINNRKGLSAGLSTVNGRESLTNQRDVNHGTFGCTVRNNTTANNQWLESLTTYFQSKRVSTMPATINGRHRSRLPVSPFHPNRLSTATELSRYITCPPRPSRYPDPQRGSTFPAQPNRLSTTVLSAGPSTTTGLSTMVYLSAAAVPIHRGGSRTAAALLFSPKRSW